MKLQNIIRNGVYGSLILICIGLFFNKLPITTLGSFTLLITTILYVIMTVFDVNTVFAEEEDFWF